MKNASQEFRDNFLLEYQATYEMALGLEKVKHLFVQSVIHEDMDEYTRALEILDAVINIGKILRS